MPSKIAHLAQDFAFLGGRRIGRTTRMIRAAGAVLRDGGHVIFCVAGWFQKRHIRELLHDAGLDAFQDQFEIRVFTGRDYNWLRGRSGTVFVDHLALEGARLGQLVELYKVASPGWDIVVDAGEEGR